MKQFILSVTCLLCSALISSAQVHQPQDGGGPYNFSSRPGDEITATQRAAIIQALKESEAKLRADGKLHDVLRPQVTAFEWPLRQAAGFTDNGYYGISNYVDENPLYPNQVLDYNCGNRTE